MASEAARADGRAPTRVHRRRRSPGHVLGALLLLALAVSTIYPLLFLALNAMKEQREYILSPYSLPSSLNLDKFDEFLFERHGWRNVANSVLVVGLSVPVVVTLAAFAANAFTKHVFRGSQRIYGGIVMLVLVPGQVLLIPLFLILSDLELIGSYKALFLTYVTLNLPFGIFLLASTMRAVPNELLEAARIDGASSLRTFVSIVVPVARAGIMTFALLAFQAMWNELTLALLLVPNDDDRLLTPTVALLPGRFSTDQPLLMAGLFVATVPTLLAVGFFSRYLERGATAGIGK